MTRLIDAEALREALKSNCKPEICHDYNTAWCEACCPHNDFEDLIDNAPTVEYPFYQEAYQTGYEEGMKLTRPHGKWITIHKQNSFGQDCICFECDKCHTYKVPIYKLMITEPLEVCPNCGADMRGDAE